MVKELCMRYRFFILLLVFNTVLFFFAPELGKQSFSASLQNLKEMLSIIPPIFLLLGLLDVWIPREMMMKYMGKGAGFKGGIIAFSLGSFAAGPLYAAFPVAGVFLKKGVSLTNVFIFLGAWSTTKIPMMLFEITQLGSRFAGARFILNIIGIVVLAVILEKTTSGEEAEEVYRASCEQTDRE
ncbi:MAG: permease [Clostridiales bacterium]|nr:permease [Clostridiales bacterium]